MDFVFGSSRKNCGNDSIFVILEIFYKMTHFISYKSIMMPTWLMNLNHFKLFFNIPPSCFLIHCLNCKFLDMPPDNIPPNFLT